ncbi:MAG: Fe-S protein assembly co-chaperone HscB [Pasteurellaceae bacterium]|nr:Fe-S protein assembly co-chaperone HscB [Pasteurellaceae bacterium]
MNNPFELFDLPIAFEIDQQALSSRYLALQKSLHPDNFVHASSQEQRLSMQKSAEINDALQILKDPIARTDCIIALNTGEQVNVEEKSSRDLAFLMQQMEWREQLEELEQRNSLDELADFSQQIISQQREFLSQISSAVLAKNWQLAGQLNDRLRFIKKLIVEIERIEDKLAEF